MDGTRETTHHGAAQPGPEQLSAGSLVTSVALLLFCWIPVLGTLGAVGATVLGRVATTRARRRGAPTGRAVAATVLGAVALAVSLLFLLLWVLIFTSEPTVNQPSR